MWIQEICWYNRHSMIAKLFEVSNFTNKIKELDDNAFDVKYLGRMPNGFEHYVIDINKQKIVLIRIAMDNCNTDLEKLEIESELIENDDEKESEH